MDLDELVPKVQIAWAYHLTGLAHIGIILVIAVIAHLCVQLGFAHIIRELKAKRKRGKLPVAEGFFSALTIPLRVLIWVVALSFITDLIIDRWTDWTVPSPTPKIIRLAFVIAIAWFLFRWKMKIQKSMEKQIKKGHMTMQRHQLEAVGKLLSLVILIVTVILALQVIGLDLRALVTIGGFGTLAVGLAGKDVFANFFSGVMLYFTHPFNIGDRIQVPEKNLEGIIEGIGWYLTTIRGYDKRPIYVPNSIFSTVQVVNGTRMTNRRIRMTLTLRYQDFAMVQTIIEDIEAMLQAREDLEHLPTTTVRLVNYGDYSLELLLQAFTRTTAWAEFMNVQQDVLFHCGEIVRKHGADFAYPTTTISIEQEKPIVIEGLAKN